MEEAQPQPAAVAQAPCWSSILKSQPPPKPVEQHDVASADRFIVGSCKSSKGVAIAVVDANAVIEGGQSLSSLADRFVSVPEVMSEIRDPAARRRLDFLPFPIETMEPTPESLSKVTKFAKATGDIQTLSDVDIKLIALTYTLEAQIHGTQNLRDCPPPVQTVNVKRLPEKDMPGWGTNVPNLEEWEALEQEGEDGSNAESKILPLKDLNLNVIPESDLSGEALSATADNQSENQEDFEGGLRTNKRYPPKKKDVVIDGKKMVADGIDASKGEVDADAGDWMPAVSRSTHRRFLRRKARRESNEALFEKECGPKPENTVDNNEASADFSLRPCPGHVKSVNGTSEEAGTEAAAGLCGTEGLPPLLNQLSLQEESCTVLEEGKDLDLVEGDEDDVKLIGAELDVSSQTNASGDESYPDDESSEQSWMVRSMSESTVACVTSDFAMQNVILQMGLRLLAPGGMQIRQLQRWILKCHACYAVTAEMGRIFCPNCGNGGTLRRAAVTVNENGIIMAAHQPRIRLRGTKFSLPSPQGGRDAITKNLILREDQLPHKYLHPKTKKKTNKEIEFMTPDNIFVHHTDKRSPFQPPVRKAMAVFSGKRNPNDNHYSRARH